MRTYKDEDIEPHHQHRRRASRIFGEPGHYYVDIIPGDDCYTAEVPIDVVDYLENQLSVGMVDPELESYKDDHDLYLEGLECQ